MIKVFLLDLTSWQNLFTNWSQSSEISIITTKTRQWCYVWSQHNLPHSHWIIWVTHLRLKLDSQCWHPFSGVCKRTDTDMRYHLSRKLAHDEQLPAQQHTSQPTKTRLFTRILKGREICNPCASSDWYRQPVPSKGLFSDCQPYIITPDVVSKTLGVWERTYDLRK